MSLAYWGRKSKEYMNEILNMYPSNRIDLLVDACMGSGSFSENISCQLNNVERIAFEMDKGVYTLHKVIKEQWDVLVGRMLQFKFSESDYKQCRKMINSFNAGESNYEEIDIALAELVLLYFSHNNMRGNTPRRLDSYKKYEDEPEREKHKRALELVTSRFYLKAPGHIVGLHEKWQRLQIVCDNFMNHTDLWENPNAWIFIDPPYELTKRGVYENEVKKCRTNFGYDVDMTLKEHEHFIMDVIYKHEKGKLLANMVICTSYEMNDKGQIIIPDNDLYSKLLQHGFRLVEIKKRTASNYYETTENTDPGKVKKKRRRKMEVVYINYQTI